MLEMTEIGRFLGEMIGINGEEPTNLEELEIQAEQLLSRIGRLVLQQWLELNEERDPRPTTRCRQCGKQANFIKKRAGFANTRFGLIRYERATYVCPHCYSSTCPLDERLNPYESLARMRTQIATGKSLPVSELAKAWGLGSLKGPKKKKLAGEQRPIVTLHSESRSGDVNFSIRSNNKDAEFASTHVEGGKSNGNPIS